MGADITIRDRMALIKGVDKIYGARVAACDLRCGAALVIAALMAKGTTIIHDIYHIDRGYEDIVSKLSDLGANIRREII